MLEELHAKDLALIEETWLAFGSGMTVLTGETGAGKTVLLGALKLLLGERADASSVRSGADEAVVEGRFSHGGEDVLVRRRVGADGRSRCTVDGGMSTVGALAERVGPLVDLHGQHEHQALLSVATHVGYLDRWAGPAAARALGEYRDARAEWAAATAHVTRIQADVDAARMDAEQLDYVASQIDAVDPREGEDVELEMRLPGLMHAGRLAEAANEAAAAVRSEGGAADDLARAVQSLRRVEGIDPALDAISASLKEAQALVDELGMAARSYRDSVEHDPAALDAVQARLSSLAGLTRRYGPTLSDVIARRDEARSALAMASSGEERLSAARGREAECRRTFEEAERALSSLRHEAAPSFTTALAEVTAELAMPGARFEISFGELAFEQWTADGGERIEFRYAPAPGQQARALARIASGGELSRVMLALKGVLGGADSVETLVFDEVDAGIGGATATAVGKRLARLAETHQVIVVTHLAQVAAFADAHYVVRKLVEDGSAATTVVPVEGADRVAEIARMLSGSDSQAGRTHAAELLSAAEHALRTD